ncbi:hypothetical protein D1007_05275 [Hordeum vulgare]|uniref:Predicted protein n=1 Tax=Hordeum vulgare subsp. vulgare TaxID=112509 RepID=F2EAT5_HORVV|nr:hypothetical protein D1007_05275 [Hordeum vulgare]KAI4984897.1 hypothetical protein ZWY2020_017527 [Hordeum vulgare]BAK04457.1 predicted protein [Hordeum vulgare subsp. vulgare]
MRKAAAASRYASYDDSPSPSPSPRRAAAASGTPGQHGGRALVAVRSGRGDLRCQAPQPHGNLGSVLRRLISMEKKPSAKNLLPVPPAAAAAPAKNGSGAKLPGLSRKLFQKAPSETKRKALTEVKNSGNANTRTLAMVLRSERELLSQSKEQEDEIAALRLQLQQKDKEVERLKDLCLRQREEISTLKDAVLFPDTEPDRHVRDEISTLTGQIQCLAEELAQVKAEKNTSRSCFDDEYCSSPSTPVLNEETAFSLECSIGEAETPPNYGSPDEMFVKDLNPCLTPFSKSRSEEYEESLSSHRIKGRPDPHLSSSRLRPMSKSSDNHHKPISGTGSSKRRVHRTDQDKVYQNLF